MKKKITILNTSIVTAHGNYWYEPCSLRRAKHLVKRGYRSAIGHESTAQVISTLLGIDCRRDRIQYQQEEGESALVFKLKGRAPEGKILTSEEIEEIGYEWGVLTRIREQPEPSILEKIKTGYWWFTDHIGVPFLCFLLTLGLVSAAINGLMELLN